jgi:hypothetical protein
MNNIITGLYFLLAAAHFCIPSFAQFRYHNNLQRFIFNLIEILFVFVLSIAI